MTVGCVGGVTAEGAMVLEGNLREVHTISTKGYEVFSSDHRMRPSFDI
jgi:hypothetical protein